MKYGFLNDYSEGCHPNILTGLAEHNTEQVAGYGADKFSESARDLLRDKGKSPDASIHFVTCGTQANLFRLAALLKPFEAVIASETGHKIITAPSIHGTLTHETIHQAVKH